MDPITAGVFCIGFLLMLMAVGVNIGYSFILSGFVTSFLMLSFDAAASFLGQAAYNSVARPTWAAIPLFMLMGAFCSRGGLARIAYLGTYTLTRAVPGSLLTATCLSCGLFGAISGSSIATTVMFGKMALPEMNKFGYDRPLSVGCIAAAGTFASMIPPSILLIVYALFTQQSVAKLFAAGVFPGLLTIFAYIVMIVVLVKRNPKLAPVDHPVETDSALDQSRTKAVLNMWPIFLIAGVVLGGLYGGFLTPTEAAAAGALVSLVLAFALRTFSGIGDVNSAMNESARVTAMLFLLVIGALYYSRVIALTTLPQVMTASLLSLDIPPFAVLLMIMATMFVLGMIMVPVGVFALTLPIVLPILTSFGYDPIWFGVIALKLTEIGAITPPVGLNVFAIKAVIPRGFKISMTDIYRGCAPFILVDLGVLALLVIFPGIALWLPSLL
ncbi:MAG: TRAP transporter large permease [Phycisphaeraceae bacterium]